MADQSLKQPVLVLGESSRATLAVARSLGRRGIEVHLGASTNARQVSSSRYVQRVIILPSPSTHKSDWIKGINRAALEHGYALVMPTTESTTVPLIESRTDLDPSIKCAIPSSESFARTIDKRKTFMLATELGIPLPRMQSVEDIGQLDAALSRCSLPVVVKPVFSRLWSGDREIGLSVGIGKGVTEAKQMATDRLLSAPVLLQEYFKGCGIGQEFLCRDGKILIAFQHDRVHESNGSGGSTCRVSAPLHPLMLAASKKLLEALQWDGVVMIEYRHDMATDTFVLIEINGRFWGSLPLPVALGVDFPYGLYQQHISSDVTPISHYRSGIYARSIFEDMKQFRGSFISFAREYAIAGWRLLTGGEHWDQFALDDPKPFFIACASVVRKVFGSIAARVARFAQEFIYHIPGVRTRARARLVRQFTCAHQVLFVCFGNINRSAFAENYMRLHDSTRRAVSAGTYRHSGRPASEAAKLSAGQFGVSLDNHRSTVLSESHVAEADVILVMDSQNMKYMQQHFPHALQKTHYLGLADPSGRINIRDPYGESRGVFDQTFARIAHLVDALI